MTRNLPLWTVIVHRGDGGFWQTAGRGTEEEMRAVFAKYEDVGCTVLLDENGKRVKKDRLPDWEE